MFQIKFIDRMDASTNWTVLGNDTVNLADSTVRILGKYSLEFDKANGTDNSTIAGAYRAISLNLDNEGAQLHDKLQWAVYLSALTNVANCFVKLGTDATNNNQYLVADTSLRTGWTLCTAVLGEPYAINGTGWNPLDIKYMQVGVTFDAETDALADIKVDSVVLVPSRYTEDNTEITMDGVSVEANLDALEVLVAATNALLATIDADTGAIKTATELIDDAIVADDAAFTPGTTKVMMTGAEFDDTTPDSVDEGDGGAVRMSQNRNLYATIRDAAGNERGLNVDASNNIGVTGVGGDTTIVDDAAFTPATTSVNMIGATFDDAAPDSIDEGDAGAVRMSANRNLYQTMRDAAGNERGVNVNASNEASVTLASAEAAEDAAAPTNTVQVGGKYEASPTEMDEGDIGPFLQDPFKRSVDASNDASQGVNQVQDATAVSGVLMTNVFALMTAAGNSAPANVTGLLYHTVSVTIAAIQTSVEYHIEVSNDGGVGYENVEVDLATETKTANDVHVYKFEGIFTHVRLVFDAEVGGTNVTLDGVYTGRA